MSPFGKRPRRTFSSACGLWWAALLAAAAVYVVGATAHAQTRAAVLPMTLAKSIDERSRAAFEDSLHRGLRRGGLSPVGVLPPADPGPCEHDCLARLAAGVQARYVVTSHLRGAGRDFTLELAVVDVDTGDEVATALGSCEICGLAEVGALLSDKAAAAAHTLASRDFASAHIVTSPPGASAYVDGELIGATPATYRGAPGEHTLVLEKPGHVSQEQVFEGAAGVTAHIQIQLAATPSAPADEARAVLTTRLLREWGWVGIGLGAATTAAGATLIGIDETPIRRTCTGIGRDADGDCIDLHDTMAAGATLTALGIAAVVTGVALEIVAAKRRRAHKKTARIRAQGLGVSVRF